MVNLGNYYYLVFQIQHIHIPPQYILYGRENLCATHPGANGPSPLCAMAGSCGTRRRIIEPRKIGVARF